MLNANSYSNIKYGVPQGSIVGPLLFNIYICDLFLQDYKCDIAGYEDDNIPYTSDISLYLVLDKLERSTLDLFRWFKENHMKANSDKCHLLMITNALTSVNINGFQITNTTKEKLSLMLNSLLKTISQVSVRRQFKNYMY